MYAAITPHALDARELWQAHVKEGLRRSHKMPWGAYCIEVQSGCRVSLTTPGLAVLFGLLGQAKPSLSHFHQGQSLG
jgi:hypothetical protein